MRRNVLARLGTALLLVAAVGGCDGARHTTSFSIPPPDARTKLAGAGGIGVKVSVSDLRTDTSRLAGILDAFTQRVVIKVVTTQAVDAEVAKSIEMELASRGIRPAEGPAFLLVDIATAEGTASASFTGMYVWGDVVLSAKVLSGDGRILYSQDYRRNQKGFVPGMFPTKDEGKAQMEIVMAATIREMIDDGKLVEALIDGQGR
ncbi:MAG: hypothetical protein HY985_03465 [Magnetospirillum sp.]|nr:hypothetical protein [Magnetospirillum sp.]